MSIHSLFSGVVSEQTLITFHLELSRTNGGKKVLPYRMKSHMQFAEVGRCVLVRPCVLSPSHRLTCPCKIRYAYMTADMSPRTLHDLTSRLKNDSMVSPAPNQTAARSLMNHASQVIRHNVVKLRELKPVGLPKQKANTPSSTEL